eukprot:SM000040S14845  [mRNA]  locus=s40:787299:788000:+ [translate_table: standard]
MQVDLLRGAGFDPIQVTQAEELRGSTLYNLYARRSDPARQGHGTPLQIEALLAHKFTSAARQYVSASSQRASPRTPASTHKALVQGSAAARHSRIDWHAASEKWHKRSRRVWVRV